MLPFESISYFLEDIFVEFSVGDKLGFDLQFFLALGGDLVSFFEKVLDLIFALFEKVFKLFVLAVFLPGDGLEVGENHEF